MMSACNAVFILYLAAGRLHSVHPIGEIISQSYGLLLQKVVEGWPTWTVRVHQMAQVTLAGE